MASFTSKLDYLADHDCTLCPLHEQWTARFNRLFDEEKDELGDLPAECERLFNTYLRRWREDYDTYKVARLHDGSPGVEFVVEVPLEKWGLQSPFKGRIDLLVKDREYGGLWIWDHKWVRGIPDIDERMARLPVFGSTDERGCTRALSSPKLIAPGARGGVNVAANGSGADRAGFAVCTSR